MLRSLRVVTLVAAGLLAAAPVFALRSPARPMRDTYPRQPVDVQHYRFMLTLSDTTDRIDGEATVRMTMLAAGLRSVALDLIAKSTARQGRGMTVNAVLRDGKSLAFTHSADRLQIALDAPSRAGEVLSLQVRYAGIPADGLQIKPNRYGDRGFFSDDWPDKARHWLPTVDHIADKATMEMDVVAPAHYQVVSNGHRVETTDLPNATRRTVWREDVPISPWLYVLGVANFAVQHVGDFGTVPIETWVFAQDRDAGFRDFAEPTHAVLAFYSDRIGPFAYEKLANIQSNSVSGGMEAASAILYSAGSVTGTRSVRWRNVVIHEIAHQWFGDAVTESDWNDVWLSEGFATYFTLLFIEHAYGRDEFVQGLRDSRNTVIAFDAKNPNYRVIHENLSDMAQVTSAMTYQKGSWTLHMLRQLMGDDQFWTGTRDYYARHRNATASTDDFRRAMERASGLDLQSFFAQWLTRGGVPHIAGTWRWDATAKQVTVDLTQTQAGEPFVLPLELGVVAANGAMSIERTSMTARVAQFRFAAPIEPSRIELDPMVRALVDGQLVRQR